MDDNDDEDDEEDADNGVGDVDEDGIMNEAGNDVDCRKHNRYSFHCLSRSLSVYLSLHLNRAL